MAQLNDCSRIALGRVSKGCVQWISIEKLEKDDKIVQIGKKKSQGPESKLRLIHKI